jgi:hypothetical protein
MKQHNTEERRGEKFKINSHMFAKKYHQINESSFQCERQEKS